MSKLGFPVILKQDDSIRNQRLICSTSPARVVPHLDLFLGLHAVFSGTMEPPGVELVRACSKLISQRGRSASASRLAPASAAAHATGSGANGSGAVAAAEAHGWTGSTGSAGPLSCPRRRIHPPAASVQLLACWTSRCGNIHFCREAGSAETRQEGGANKGCGTGAGPAGGGTARRQRRCTKAGPAGGGTVRRQRRQAQKKTNALLR